MKANELRIGNYLNYDLGICKVRGTTKNAVWLHDEGGPVIIDGFLNIRPIPLTEDILLKCGFVYRNEHRGQGSILDLHNENWKKGMSVAFMKDGTLRVLNHPQFDYLHLHQLQNLYFALTGDELNISI